MWMTSEREIVGSFKMLGSKDPDAVFAQKNMLLKGAKFLKLIGWCCIALGIPMLFLIIPGIIMIVLGWFLLSRAKKNIALIESAAASYCAEVGISSI